MAAWDMFREMDELRREIDHVFRGLGVGRGLSPAFIPGIGVGDFPRINVSQDENNYYIHAMVPGIDPSDLELNIMQGTLTLSGERKESGNGDRSWHRRERGFGKFLRTVELPERVNTEKVDARYHNGILTITLGKAEEAKAKKISVKAS
ncbi:MAG: Hsp20/alpha crystallin family protein [Syntrophotaleaceae bacterium]